MEWKTKLIAANTSGFTEEVVVLINTLHSDFNWAAIELMQFDSFLDSPFADFDFINNLDLLNFEKIVHYKLFPFIAILYSLQIRSLNYLISIFE